jgi:hypothetical protein
MRSSCALLTCLLSLWSAIAAKSICAQSLITNYVWDIDLYNIQLYLSILCSDYLAWLTWTMKQYLKSCRGYQHGSSWCLIIISIDLVPRVQMIIFAFRILINTYISSIQALIRCPDIADLAMYSLPPGGDLRNDCDLKSECLQWLIAYNNCDLKSECWQWLIACNNW